MRFKDDIPARNKGGDIGKLQRLKVAPQFLHLDLMLPHIDGPQKSDIPPHQAPARARAAITPQARASAHGLVAPPLTAPPQSALSHARSCATLVPLRVASLRGAPAAARRPLACPLMRPPPFRSRLPVPRVGATARTALPLAVPSLRGAPAAVPMVDCSRRLPMRLTAARQGHPAPPLTLPFSSPWGFGGFTPPISTWGPSEAMAS